MKGTEKQIAYAKDIIKEWHEREAKKKAFFEEKGITEEGKKLMQQASEILNERIEEEDKAWEIIASQYSKKFDWEHILNELAKAYTNR